MALSNSSPSAASFNTSHNRTWLLPGNRRLRNLISISLRNLSFSAHAPTRPRGKTIDDDALPQTLQSPAKRVSLREQGILGHSRSSNDLRAVSEDDVRPGLSGGDLESKNDADQFAAPRLQHAHTVVAGNKQTELGRMRRRSTLEWANAEPHKRQESLEGLISKHLVDVFFSLHADGVEEPVYVSEVAGGTMNPTFRDIDWDACGPGITRLDHITLRVWVQHGNGVDTWLPLFAVKLNLRQARFMGRNLDAIHDPLPRNAILLHLVDGVYIFHTWLSPKGTTPPNPSKRVENRSAQKAQPSASFDVLLRLSKLDDSIQDALAVRDRLANDLESLLQSNKEALTQRDLVAESEDRLKTIEFAKKMVERQVEKGRRQLEEKQQSLASRRQLMTADLQSRESEKHSIADSKTEQQAQHQVHGDKQRALQDHRRRVCEDIQHSYPIEAIQGKPLAFTIRGLHLPNADDLDSETPENIAAAYGYVAHILQLFSLYLSQALPYPVDPRGSTTTIYDPISILKTSSSFSSQTSEQTLRTYPLFSKGVPRFRFEYAVFLINQDIRILLEDAFNLRVLDIRQTLPNLKYLLFVATAGEGELPARKAGGVRGLLRAPHHTFESRSGSCDSTSSRMSGLTLMGNGKAKGAADKLREMNSKTRS